MRLSARFGIRLLLLFSLLGFFLDFSLASPVQAQTAVVRAVLFYSPSCPHCHKVITEDLPPLLEKYGDQLEIIGVDTSSSGGQELFRAAIEWHKVPPTSQAVPMLFVDDVMLLGSIDIPEQFPGLIEKYLAQGGVDWPAIPGLREAIEASQSQAAQTPSLGKCHPAKHPSPPLKQALKPMHRQFHKVQKPQRQPQQTLLPLKGPNRPDPD